MACNEEVYFPRWKWLKRFNEMSGPNEVREQVELLVANEPKFVASIIGFFVMMHLGYKSLTDIPLFVSDDEKSFAACDYRAVRSFISDWFGWPYGWLNPNVYNRKSRQPATVELGDEKNPLVLNIGGFSMDERVLNEVESSAIPEGERDDPNQSTPHPEDEKPTKDNPLKDEHHEFVEDMKLFFMEAVDYVNSVDTNFCDEEWIQILQMAKEANDA